ncbi:MAG TPA: hypothetical protein PLR50_02700 [Candidatus Rifleibacterium sp.]|jgi:hypothetical protein|nr:hypothetical protein [Candidatus Rifleibacterium sp.]
MKTAGNKDLNKDQFEIPESSADDGGMSVPEAKCNVWDILARQALEESKAGKTITLEEFEEKMKAEVLDDLVEYAQSERASGKSIELRAYARKHKISLSK